MSLPSVQAATTSSAAAFGETGRPLVLQILAHPDDDLYFMNPHTAHALRDGIPVVSVYITAGESAGFNRAQGLPRPAPDKAAYSAARHQGLRQAYAEILGVDRFTRWQRSVWVLDGGVEAEENALVHAGREARLIHLNIAMLSRDGVGWTRLPALWKKPGASMHTLIAPGSAVSRVSTYRHETLVDALVQVMERFKPTLMHTLDPDPDLQVHDAAHPQDDDQPGHSDHRDHTPAALFAWKAMGHWATTVAARTGRTPQFAARAFRGYYHQRWPPNLPPEILREKGRILDAYGGAPDWACGDPSGCGDYSQGRGHAMTNRKGWIRSTRPRHAGPPLAAVVERSGRVFCYGVLGTQAAEWRETSPGSGRLGAPRNLGGGPLAPVVSVTGASGQLLLCALRFSTVHGLGQADTRDIVVLEGAYRSSDFGTWRSLGNPEHNAERGRRIGSPVVVRAPDGQIHLFIRNARKSISTRVRDHDGRWSDWRSLPGGEVHDGLTTLVDAKGCVHVYAAGRDAVHHWSQNHPRQSVEYRPDAAMPVSCEQPSAFITPDGATGVVYRSPAASSPSLYTGLGLVSPQRFPGYGPVTAMQDRNPRTVLLGTDLDGGVQLQVGTGPSSQILRPLHPLVPAGPPTPLHSAPQDVPIGALALSHGAEPWIWRPTLLPAAPGTRRR
ncbi:PIG-L family deacetylase [Streptomyces sp. YS-3]|uniref:PIG-L family deacetylase n=1 Tax=Streptomyces sp. YS-3 TaxID=3381352 RepID=UPI003862A1E4